MTSQQRERTRRARGGGTKPSVALALTVTAITWAVFAGLHRLGFRDPNGTDLTSLAQMIGSATVAVALVVAGLSALRWRATADRRYIRVAVAVLALGGLRAAIGVVAPHLTAEGTPALLRALPGLEFLAALALLMVPSPSALGRPKRRLLAWTTATALLGAGTAILTSPAAAHSLARQVGTGTAAADTIAQGLVTAGWFIALASYWRDVRHAGGHFDWGVVGMLAALAQSRLAIAVATASAPVWLVASQMFRFEAVLILAIGLNREMHDELLRSQVMVHRLITERRQRDRDDAERRHDVKAALFSVVAAAEMLERQHGRLDSTTAQVLTRALAAETTHLQHLVLQGRREDIDVFSLSDVVRPLVVLEEARGQNMRLYIDEDVTVLGRPSEMAEALRNVLENARTHGGAMVVVRVARQAGTGVVRIEDTGPGIPPNEQRTIFERGARGTAATSDGSGLGLYVTARLLREMGGDIWLDPKRAYGSAFTCCLPAAPDNVRLLHPEPVAEELAL